MSNSTPATIEDVARIAEVSIATVSRAIHTPEKVANSTRLKVHQAIAITATRRMPWPAACALAAPT